MKTPTRLIQSILIGCQYALSKNDTYLSTSQFRKQHIELWTNTHGRLNQSHSSRRVCGHRHCFTGLRWVRQFHVNGTLCGGCDTREERHEGCFTSPVVTKNKDKDDT
jgi:hypothetical protein